jgi:uncharacterized membrane protein YidH (DUF202 family)
MTERPDDSFDDGLQHERTTLAWERTAISLMVSGIVFARFAALDAHWLVASLGLVQTAFGGGVLIWSTGRYRELHDHDLHARRGGDPAAHPTAARIVGTATISVTTLALFVALATG